MPKFRYTGDASEITLRGVVFPKGKAVSVEDEALADKISVLPYFALVKTRRRKNDQDEQ